MNVKEVIDIIESFAPLGIQESWDNSGLIIGDPDDKVAGVLLCVDLTEAILDEARTLACNMIISHHPMVFSGMKKFTGTDQTSRLVRRSIREGFIIYSAHTNLDQVEGGVSGAIAQTIGLKEPRVLVPRKEDLLKLVSFIPEDYFEKVSSAVFQAGAGHIGKYDSCGYSALGNGTFRPGKGANPFSGKPGELHSEAERRFETVFPKFIRARVISALLKAHPYEEVAYDLYPIINDNPSFGLGIVGDLENSVPEVEFMQTIKSIFGARCIRHTELLGKNIKRVAVCGGSGSEFMVHAIKAGADVYITADVKYHQFFDPDKRILLLDIGHYESEQVALKILNSLFLKKMTNFAVHLSSINTNPINYF